MKVLKLLLFMAVLAALLAFPIAAAASPGDGSTDTSGDEVLVKFKTGVPASEIAQLHATIGGKVKASVDGIGIQVVSVSRGKAAEKAKGYASHPAVAYAEPNGVYAATDTPNDTYFSQQWGMKKVEAPLAWDITTGSTSVNIAIVDTGVSASHPDLAGKVIASVNFTDSPTADDVYGHGTHVAGIAAALTNNALGVAGLGYNSTIMSVKVLGDSGSGSYSWIASGIIWAANNGAEVINLSLGGTSASLTLRDAIDYAWGKGAVVVAAAGNNGTSTPFYPAYYDNCMAVAATDSYDRLPSWSNYGDWVDLAAPGYYIYSTLRTGGYGNKSGTSMASPHVAGLAGLLCATVGDSNGNGRINDEVRERIEATADPISNTGAGSGRINAFKAVSASGDPVQPAGSISGRVTDAAGGNPIAGATVSDGTRSATTGTDGAYTISGVPQGSYTVTASAPGYIGTTRTVSVASGATTFTDFSLTLVPAPTVKAMWVESIDFAMAGKNLKVSIKVAGESGPVAGASVRAELLAADGKRYLFSGTTDGSGVFGFLANKLSAGTCTVTVIDLTASGYAWDTGNGLTEASYTIGSANTKTK